MLEIKWSKENETAKLVITRKKKHEKNLLESMVTLNYLH